MGPLALRMLLAAAKLIPAPPATSSIKAPRWAVLPVPQAARGSRYPLALPHCDQLVDLFSLRPAGVILAQLVDRSSVGPSGGSCCTARGSIFLGPTARTARASIFLGPTARTARTSISSSPYVAYSNSPFCSRGPGGKLLCLGPLNPKRAYAGWVGGIHATRSAQV